MQYNLGLLTFALLVASITHGFQRSRIWERIASSLIGLAGTAAAIPLVIIAGVMLFNLFLWTAVIAVIALALMLWVPIGLLYLLLRR
jgi:hypothetical protein